MTKYIEIQRMDEIFDSIEQKLVLNDLPSDTDEDRKKINDLIMTTYDRVDILSATPSCACGALSTGANLGETCPLCKTIVVRPTESGIDLRVWLRAPEQSPGFITPGLWLQFSKMLTVSKFNLMEWITNKRCRLPARISDKVARRIKFLESINFPRGLQEFHDNIDWFISIIPQLNVSDATRMQAFFTANKDLLFCRHLPMPTKALLVLDNTHVGSFADLSITSAKDAAYTIMDMSSASNLLELTPQQIESRTVSVIKNLSSYYLGTLEGSFSDKKGWLRGHVFSSRIHFCIRGVITSISEPHHYEDIHLPWAQGLVLFAPQLISKLLKRGFNIKNAHALVENSGNVYNSLLDELFQEMCRDQPIGSCNLIFQRN